MPSVSTLRPQPPVAPLNANAKQALAELLQAKAGRKRLNDYLRDVAEKLTGVAGQLNDRGSEEQLKYTKKQARLETEGEDVDEKERAEHDAFQAKVEDLTQKMDRRVRGVIDEQVWLEAIPDVLRGVATRSGALAQATQQHTQGPTPLATQRNRGGDGLADEEDSADSSTETEVAGPPDPREAPTALLRASFKDQSSNWNAKSLTERYANTNEYTGFYRTVYDAKNPNENAPPVPHASLWFAGEEDPDSLPTASQSRPTGEDEDDSDLEIASERVSTKCPITLLTFKSPLTSTKCPHSFEKEAILDMLRTTTEYLPFTPDQQVEIDRVSSAAAKERKKKEMGTPMVKCPVCSCPLREADLKPDPVLLRKAKRMQASASRRENGEGASVDEDEDGDEDEGEAPRGTQRKPVGLGSSPARRASGRMVKDERAKSVFSGSQLPSGTQTSITAGGATVVDLGEDDEDDEDDEDEDGDGDEDMESP